MTESPLVTAARRLLAPLPDAEILSHTTADESDILARLKLVERQIKREHGCQYTAAQNAVVKVLRERRKATRKDSP